MRLITRSKASQNTMDAASMEKELVEFLTRDHNPINIGAAYGGDYPVYPGEVVIIHKLHNNLKTMLLQI